MKSIWKSKSFYAGLVPLVIMMLDAQGIIITPKVESSIMGLIAVLLVSKSAAKRMN